MGESGWVRDAMRCDMTAEQARESSPALPPRARSPRPQLPASGGHPQPFTEHLV